MTFEEAKAFYISMNCNGFFMFREDPSRYNEFRAFNINPDILEAWKQEQILELFEKLEQSKYDEWSIHSRIIDLLNSTSSQKEQNAEKLIKALEKLSKDISKKSAILMAENMAGRTTNLDDGGFRFLSGRDILIKQAFLYCTEMLDFECTDSDNDLSEYSGWKDMKRRKEEAICNMKKAIIKFTH